MHKKDPELGWDEWSLIQEQQDGSMGSQSQATVPGLALILMLAVIVVAFIVAAVGGYHGGTLDFTGLAVGTMVPSALPKPRRPQTVAAELPIAGALVGLCVLALAIAGVVALAIR